MLILEGELEYFKNAIFERGLDPSDFEVKQLQEPMQGCDIQPIVGQVMVRRKSNGIQRAYKAGHMSHWVADFADDLRKRVFGK